MKIAVINNYDSFVFNLVRYLKEEGCNVVVQRNDAIDFDILASCDGILLSPGPGIPSEAGQLNDVITTFASQKPILGVCLGHQALIEYYGGHLELAAKAMHGKASRILKTGTSALFKGIPAVFEVGRYHSWIGVAPLPVELEVTARFGDEVMAFQHKSDPVFGVQFHPESILTPQGKRIIRNFTHVVQNKKPVAL
jgi:anthranilate synthase component 2